MKKIIKKYVDNDYQLGYIIYRLSLGHLVKAGTQ